jgi:hypothetical protein
MSRPDVSVLGGRCSMRRDRAELPGGGFSSAGVRLGVSGASSRSRALLLPPAIAWIAYQRQSRWPAQAEFGRPEPARPGAKKGSSGVRNSMEKKGDAAVRAVHVQRSDEVRVPRRCAAGLRRHRDPHGRSLGSRRPRRGSRVHQLEADRFFRKANPVSRRWPPTSRECASTPASPAMGASTPAPVPIAPGPARRHPHRNAAALIGLSRAAHQVLVTTRRIRNEERPRSWLACDGR